MRSSYQAFALAAQLILFTTVARAQITTTINVPPDVAPSSIGNHTRLNLLPGGALPQNFAANSGSELNFAGGNIGFNTTANNGSTVNVSAGNLNGWLVGKSGSTINISGGDTGNYFGVTGSTVTISGGRVGQSFNAYSNSTVNMQGGLIDYFSWSNGSTVNITGGTLADYQANNHSTVNMSGGSANNFELLESTMTISGGTFGNSFYEAFGGSVTIRGGEFRLGGVLIPGLTTIGSSVTVQLTDVLSGTLADGTPFAFTTSDGDSIYDSIVLKRTSLPAIGPSVIAVPTATVPKGIRQGQSLVVNAGGIIGDNFNAGLGSSVTVHAGAAVGNNLEAVGGAFTMDGGAVGDYLGAFNGTTANVTGGSIGNNFKAIKGSTVNFSAAAIGNSFYVLSGSTLNMSNGHIGSDLQIGGDSFATITGGTIGDDFYAGGHVVVQGGSIGDDMLISGNQVVVAGGSYGDGFKVYNGNVTVQGAEFKISGTPISGSETVGNLSPYTLSSDEVLTGVLADGTPFAFSAADLDYASSNLTLQTVALPAVGPSQIIGSADTIPPGIRAGQTLTADAGTIIPANFNAGSGSTLRVQNGATVGKNLEAAGATVEISGGVVGDHFDAFYGSTLTITGGTVGEYFEAHNGSTVNIVNGAVGRLMSAQGGSVVNLSGGSLGDYFVAKSGSIVNLSGGATGVLTADTGSHVNVSGGVVGNDSAANDASNVLVTGGLIGRNFTARSGSTFVLAGGRIDESFQAYSGSHVQLNAGTIGDDFDTYSGAAVQLDGGDFRLDGVPIAGLESSVTSLPFDVPTGAVLSGLLSDGTPFAFCTSDLDLYQSFSIGDEFAAGTLTLHATDLPAVGPSHITASVGPVPKGIRQGQTLTVDSGAIVPNGFSAGRGSTVEVQMGGAMGRNFEADAATVGISGGTVDQDFDAFNGSIVNVSAGTVGDNFQAIGHSQVHVSGGAVGQMEVIGGSSVSVTGGALSYIAAKEQSTVQISAGRISGSVEASGTSQVLITGGVVEVSASLDSASSLTMSGGSVGNGINVHNGSLELVGGDFRFNNVPIAGLDTIGNTATTGIVGILTGVLSDGTPIMLSYLDGDEADSVTLRSAAIPAIGPSLITASQSPVPLGIRQGQLLVADAGSSIPNGFKMGHGSSLRIESGASVGHDLEVVNANVVMNGGTIGKRLRLFQGATIAFAGGTIDEDVAVRQDSVMNITGGSINATVEIDRASTVNMFGGSVGSYITTFKLINGSRFNLIGGSLVSSTHFGGDSFVTISGGSLTQKLQVDSGTAIVSGGHIGAIEVDHGSLRLVGTDFAYNDAPIAGLLTDGWQLISNRTGFLSGHLADGTSFRYQLDDTIYHLGSVWMPFSLPLYVTLVAPRLPGDFNTDGSVDAADYTLWRHSAGQTVAYGKNGDANFDGLVDQVDYAIWRANMGRTTGSGAAAAAIPEPATVALLTVGMLAILGSCVRNDVSRRR